jgi:hypothetical protein
MVAACYFRMRNENLDNHEMTEVERMFRGLKNNAPLTFEEIAHAPAGSRRFRTVLSESIGANDLNVRKMGHNSRAHLEKFSAKMALAFHYKFVRTPIPLGGGVYINLRNNLHYLVGAVPPAELPFGIIDHLNQGVKTSAGQFEYRYALGTDFEGGAFQVNFNDNWVITMVTSSDSRFIINSASPISVFTPSCSWKVEETPDTWSLSTREVYNAGK